MSGSNFSRSNDEKLCSVLGRALQRQTCPSPRSDGYYSDISYERSSWDSDGKYNSIIGCFDHVIGVSPYYYRIREMNIKPLFHRLYWIIVLTYIAPNR